MKVALLVVATLALQRLLALPGMPAHAENLLLAMPWVVGPALLGLDRRWYWLSFGIGLGLDLLLAPVLGPGGITWSAAALVVWGWAAVVAARSSWMWGVVGGVAGAVVVLAEALVLLPLGEPLTVSWSRVFGTTVLTGGWCGLVGVVLAIELPVRWRRWRSRKLR